MRSGNPYFLKSILVPNWSRVRETESWIKKPTCSLFVLSCFASCLSSWVPKIYRYKLGQPLGSSRQPYMSVIYSIGVKWARLIFFSILVFVAALNIANSEEFPLSGRRVMSGRRIFWWTKTSGWPPVSVDPAPQFVPQSIIANCRWTFAYLCPQTEPHIERLLTVPWDKAMSGERGTPLWRQSPPRKVFHSTIPDTQL